MGTTRHSRLGLPIWKLVFLLFGARPTFTAFCPLILCQPKGTRVEYQSARDSRSSEMDMARLYLGVAAILCLCCACIPTAEAYAGSGVSTEYRYNSTDCSGDTDFYSHKGFPLGHARWTMRSPSTSTDRSRSAPTRRPTAP